LSDDFIENNADIKADVGTNISFDEPIAGGSSLDGGDVVVKSDVSVENAVNGVENSIGEDIVEENKELVEDSNNLVEIVGEDESIVISPVVSTDAVCADVVSTDAVRALSPLDDVVMLEAWGLDEAVEVEVDVEKEVVQEVELVNEEEVAVEEVKDLNGKGFEMNLEENEEVVSTEAVRADVVDGKEEVGVVADSTIIIEKVDEIEVIINGEVLKLDVGIENLVDKSNVDMQEDSVEDDDAIVIVSTDVRADVIELDDESESEKRLSNDTKVCIIFLNLLESFMSFIHAFFWLGLCLRRTYYE
jgi:hypothetical protein